MCDYKCTMLVKCHATQVRLIGFKSICHCLVIAHHVCVCVPKHICCCPPSARRIAIITRALAQRITASVASGIEREREGEIERVYISAAPADNIHVSVDKTRPARARARGVLENQCSIQNNLLTSHLHHRRVHARRAHKHTTHHYRVLAHSC